MAFQAHSAASSAVRGRLYRAGFRHAATTAAMLASQMAATIGHSVSVVDGKELEERLPA